MDLLILVSGTEMDPRSETDRSQRKPSGKKNTWEREFGCLERIEIMEEESNETKLIQNKERLNRVDRSRRWRTEAPPASEGMNGHLHYLIIHHHSTLPQLFIISPYLSTAA